MRNYLKPLKLNTDFMESDLAATLARLDQAGSDQLSDSKWQQDAQSILSDSTKRLYYRRLHFQHQALKAAISCLADPVAEDTHRWHLRLGEFDSPPETDVFFLD